MIQIKNSEVRKKIIFTFFFSSILLTTFSLFYAEVFRTKTLQKNEIVFPLPFRDYKISDVEKILIENKNGIIEIEKENNTWNSRDKSVGQETIKNILDAFFNLRIRNLHKMNKDNLSNFSVDKPYASLDIHLLNKKIKVSLGLLNSVDNSQFILFSHLDYIYQVDQLKINFESFSPGTLQDSQIFSYEIDEITSFKIYDEKRNIVFDLNSEKQQLTSKTYPRLSSIDLRSKLINILQIKNTKILEKKGDHFEILNNYIKFPLYYIEFIVKNQTFQYIVTSPILELKNLNLAKNSHIIIMNPKNEWHLVESSALNLFQF